MYSTSIFLDTVQVKRQIKAARKTNLIKIVYKPYCRELSEQFNLKSNATKLFI